MKISGLEKLTLGDYPGHIACTIFTQGCNFKCGYCHNADLISEQLNGCLSKEDVMTYLDFRIKLLEGVVISGGEPLLQQGLKELIILIKAKGLKVKLDTNGTNIEMLRELIEERLIDYIAMDIKADADNYSKVIGLDHFDFHQVEKAIELITSSGIDYEFRTTINKEFHDLSMLENICRYIGNEGKYYLQNFRDNENVLERKFTGFSNDEIQDLMQALSIDYTNLKVRGF